LSSFSSLARKPIRKDRDQVSCERETQNLESALQFHSPSSYLWTLRELLFLLNRVIERGI